jgi:hypothetical protein
MSIFLYIFFYFYIPFFKQNCYLFCCIIQSDSRVIPNELDRIENATHNTFGSWIFTALYPALRSKCIVGCSFNYLGHIIAPESSYILLRL